MAIKSGALTMGHAKAILSMDKEDAQIRLAERVVSEGLSVRETEALAQKPATATPKKESQPAVAVPQAAQSVGDIFGKYFSGKISVKPKRNGGDIVLHYKNLEQLNVLLKALKEHNLQ